MPDYHVPHLNGCTVAILADGVVLPQQVVVDGVITLDTSYAKVTIGLPYRSQLETLSIDVPMQDGSAQGKKVKIGNVICRFVQTVGGWIGPNENELYEAFPRAELEQLAGFDFDDHVFNGDIRVPLGSGYEDGGRVFVEQRDPLPMSLTAIMPEVQIGGATG